MSAPALLLWSATDHGSSSCESTAASAPKWQARWTRLPSKMVSRPTDSAMRGPGALLRFHHRSRGAVNFFEFVVILARCDAYQSSGKTLLCPDCLAPPAWSGLSSMASATFGSEWELSRLAPS